METIQQKYEKFDKENPHVYKRLIEMTYQLKNNGHNKIGIGMLFEVLRWQSMMQTKHTDYKLNNNFRAIYARRIIDEYPDLEEMFEVRAFHGRQPL